MKRILFLFALLVTVSTTAKAETNTTLEADASMNNFVRGYGNSFIFVEGGVEFSVFADGQFDFYMPNHGPNVNVGINSPGFALSFNTGFNYNPFVQYDSFGAVIQIENTPIFYDYFGRVNQIGNIFINYNGFGRVNRIGGLNIFYRNNVFWRYDGFINGFNRAYVWRPWHRFYAFPPANFCVVNNWAYRQFYAPVRHIWYRPYRNNVRHFNANVRRGDAQLGRRSTTRNNDRYAQRPRNSRERDIRRRVSSRNAEIARSRTERVPSNTARSTHNANAATSRSTARRSTNARATGSNTAITRQANTRSNTTTRTPNRSSRSNEISRTRTARKNVTKSRSNVSNTRSTSVRKPKATSRPNYTRSSSQNRKQRSVVQNKRKPSSVSKRSNSSKSSNRSATRSNSRRTQ